MSAPQPGSTDPAVIRNFCIIAHIDHGKSTLADRMLQITGVLDERSARAQYLDRMDIERERGITIKSQAVRMPWEVDGVTHLLNMIDTPGHVDFSYEVSRSLQACEGAILLVDAAQGIEAQTLANLYLALEADLEIIPVLNKIDLPGAESDRHAAEIAGIIGCDESEVLRVSAKTGEGVSDLLDTIVAKVPAPEGVADAPARALIFDSVYDTYRGVVTYVRVVDGALRHREKILMMSTGAAHEVLEIGVISPEMVPAQGLSVGRSGTSSPASRMSVNPESATLSPMPPSPLRKILAAISTPNQWCIRDSSRLMPRISLTCVMLSTSCSSTTLPWSTSLKPRRPWALAFGSGSSGCCTWRSCASV